MGKKEYVTPFLFSNCHAMAKENAKALLLLGYLEQGAISEYFTWLETEISLMCR